jgi:RNA polymerase sigma-70 factor (ECF subfamily)
MAKPTDRELVDQARSGDSQAFGLLVRRHQKRIFRLAFHLVRTGAEAEDVTQETFVRAYQALDRFDGRSEPFTWLYRIAVNLSLNTIRSRKTTRDSTSVDDPRIEGLLGDAPEPRRRSRVGLPAARARGGALRRH